MAVSREIKNPFPGPRPFEQGETIFGRDEEIGDLLSLLVAHRVVLLYSQSGAGKTSLLNAGLIPKLERRGFDVLPVSRVGGQSLSAEELARTHNVYVSSAILGWNVAASSVTIGQALGEGNAEPTPRVAIFDQFEELFSAYPERWKERDGFFAQLAEALESDPLFRVLLVIREDYMAHLDPYADLLPEALRTRYRLERLRRDATFEAIDQPVTEAGLTFEDGVASQLIDDLLEIHVEAPVAGGRKVLGEFVEPVHLQVVCRTLFDQLPQATAEITKDHLKTFGDVDRALEDFYRRALEATKRKTGVRDGDLRSFFETQLITPAGTRGTVFRGADRTGGLANRAVDELEDQHVIRAEIRAGSRWYELTHDRLIEPVRKANEQWRRNVERWQIVKRIRLPVGAITILFMAFAIWQADNARQAHVRELTALAALSQTEDPARALYLGLQAAQMARSLPPLLEGVLATSLTNGPSLAVLRSHTAVVHSVVWSPDGKALASASDDKTIRLWEAASGQPLRTLQGHQSAVYSVAWSPDSKTLASAGHDETVRLWGAAGGQPLRTLQGHRSAVYSVAWSPDGKTLASASWDQTIRLWEAASGQPLRTLQGHQNPVNSVVWSPDGKTLASASWDQTIRLWEAASGQPLRTLEGHQDPVNSVVWSPDGKTLASASDDKTIRLWEAASGQPLRTLQGHQSAVYSVAWSPDGKALVSAGSDRTIRLWQAASGQPLPTLQGHQSSVISVNWSPDGKTLASASADNAIRLWEAATRESLRTLQGHQAAVISVAWSPDGKTLASASTDNMIGLWKAANGQSLRKLQGHPDTLVSVAWSPDATTLASASRDQMIRLWDAANGQLLRTLQGHRHLVHRLAWSPDGKTLASASDDKTIRLWEATSGQPLRTLEGHQDSVYSVAWSRDSKTLASAGRDQTIRLWEAVSGQPLRTMQGHQDTVISVAWSPDAKTLASASADRTIRLWEASSGQPLRTLHHQGIIFIVAWSPDGKTLASASQRIRLWEAASGQPLRTLEGHQNVVNSVAWSPDGNTLASGSQDRTILLWPGNVDALLDQVRDRIRLFSLSKEECQRYFQSDSCPPVAPSNKN